MKVSRSRQLAAAVALSSAVIVGAASPVSAAPSSDPLAPITAFAASASVGDLAAPQGMSGHTLLAAHRAGIPIYEAAQIKTFYQGGKIGFKNFIEYRRVYDSNAVGSPTAKFLATGESLLDTFYVVDAPGARGIGVNPHEVRQDNVTLPMASLDTTPYNFNKSPAIQLPGGGPSVGIAFVSGSSSS
ncbi:hypothetical protein BFN03_13410 [Rhodococcus sp. WMMA185]|uniref:hypothetical protein n=1 Tax=Rhodococcus sp. WMMA185 TaxID=679318 RepID=UPI0008785054|nr:hypothetical protein [Rhodococcus sp. WMMA185]AOW93310.1 hypothetical protein BFN03_13410 [Rhodococcus sp. WMMA185]